MALAKEQIRQIINQNDITSVADVYSVKKWTQRYRGWDQVLNQLLILYGERLNQYL